MTDHISKMNLEAARSGIRWSLKRLSLASEVLTEALNDHFKYDVRLATKVYTQRNMVATRMLQTIIARSRLGWEKARADDMVARIANNFNSFDYEIDAEPHLPKEWT